MMLPSYTRNSHSASAVARLATGVRATAKPCATCKASTNGTAPRQGMNASATRTMYVADVDMSQDYPSTSARPQVAPMEVPANNMVAHSIRTSAPLSRQSGTDLQLTKDNRALKEDLLKAKADLSVQAQEVQDLRSKLADRDRSLQLTKAELIETRIHLQEKELLLQEAYERLRKATHERSEYRRYLSEAERELRTTRSELIEWSHGLMELKNVMDGLDDSFGELVGTSYADVMAEIEDSLQELKDEDAEIAARPADAMLKLRTASLDEATGEDELLAITEALRGLHELSQEILDESKEDAAYFS